MEGMVYEGSETACVPYILSRRDEAADLSASIACRNTYTRQPRCVTDSEFGLIPLRRDKDSRKAKFIIIRIKTN